MKSEATARLSRDITSTSLVVRSGSGQGHDESVEEDEIADLIEHTDLLAQRRFARLAGYRLQYKVPREGSDGAHPQQPIDYSPQARQPAAKRGEKNRAMTKQGYCRMKKRSGRLGKGTPCG